MQRGDLSDNSYYQANWISSLYYYYYYNWTWITLTLQSRVVTSLLLSWLLVKCFNSAGWEAEPEASDPEGPSGILHIRAVESPDLLYRKKKYLIICYQGIHLEYH